jgi:hypothetical protein
MVEFVIIYEQVTYRNLSNGFYFSRVIVWFVTRQKEKPLVISLLLVASNAHHYVACAPTGFSNLLQAVLSFGRTL